MYYDENKTSNNMLYGGAESRCSCIAPDMRVKTFSILLLRMFAVVFS